MREVREMSDRELIALVVGGRRREDVAEILTKKDEIYRDFPRMTCEEELEISYAMTPVEARRLLAAKELGRRIYTQEKAVMLKAADPGTVAEFMGWMRFETHERFMILLLNSKGKVITVKQISEGSLNASVVHPREVYREACLTHAAAVIAVHNHPSGSSAPSREDRELTRTLWDSGKILGIPFTDHIIIGDDEYYSFKEHGLL